ncbi:MAG: ATP-binding cassette domain-containing protein, partial [Cyanobacteria bacterium]|nr:ATP-binding cassette domain-containing protein [Cyanobacteriota bacterium]
GLLKQEVAAGHLSVLLITHKFREVQSFADEVTILRRGQLAGQGHVKDLTIEAMAEMMLGQERTPKSVSKAEVEARTPVLEVTELQANKDNGLPAVKGVNLQVHTGEIVGIAGVSGNGQREFVECLSGQRVPVSGHLKVNGEPYTATRPEMAKHSVYALPEEPLKNACVPNMSVAENMALRTFDRPPQAKWNVLLMLKAIRDAATGLVQAFSVKTPSIETPVSHLSGGNVQRTVLARELSSQDVRLLIAANPSFGLDFAAVDFIHDMIVAARNRGVAVLLVSEDLDELLTLADRIIVMSEGEFVYESAIAEVDLKLIGQGMAGH